MNRDLIRQLKSLKHTEIKPSEKWLKSNRELLLSQIKNTISHKEKTSNFNFETLWQAMSIFLPSSFVYKVVRPVVVVMLIIGMGIGSWVVTASASSDALPGEWLYSAKRATEQTQVAVADAVGDTNGSTRLHVQFAKRRADETKKIIDQVKNDPAKIQVAVQAVSDLRSEMQTVNTKLAEIKSTQGGSSAEAAQNISQSAQEIKDVLKDVKVSLLANSTTSTASSTNDLSAQVSEVKNLAKDTAVDAVAVMVDKQSQGDNTVSKDEIKQAISDQLQSAVKDAADSKQSVDVVNKAIGEVNGVAHIEKDAALASSTQALSKETQAAASSTQQLSTEAGKTVDEGQVLLSKGDLASAVDKIKQANTATTQSEKVSDDTLKSVQNTLPPVAVVVAAVPDASSTPVIVTTTPSSSLSIILGSASATIKLSTSTLPAIIPTTTNRTTTIRIKSTKK